MSTHEHSDDSGAGQYSGSYAPTKRPPDAAYERTVDGRKVLPSIFYAPTASSKFRELRAELDALERTLERGKGEVSGDALEKIECTLRGLRLGASFVEGAYLLGQDSISVTSTTRFCPGCKAPLDKFKQFCARCRKERRKIQNSRAKQKQRNVSKRSKTL